MNDETGEATEYSVKAANKKFYNAISDNYEKIDGRRSPKLENWLREKLFMIRQKTHGDCLLDIGTGSGLVTRCAEGLFALRVGLDISTNMIKTAKNTMSVGLVADVDNLPFANNSFDVVTCFALLHHMYSFDGLVREISRVLKPGGIFYSDHDLDKAFSKLFRLPLLLYRKYHTPSLKYKLSNRTITDGIYNLTEWHKFGIDAVAVIRALGKTGFTVNASFHWFGLSPLFDKLIRYMPRHHGLAPLSSIIAVKLP